MTGPESNTDYRAAATKIRAAKKRKRLFIRLGLAALVLLVIVLTVRYRRSRFGSPEGLVTAKVQPRVIVETVSATGSIQPQTGAMVNIGSQMTGRVKRLYADVGSKVEAGQLIAELDIPELEAQVRQAEATLQMNRARLSEQLAGVELQDTQTSSEISRAEANLSVAKSNLARVEQSTEAEIAAAQASVRQAQANAANSEANLRRTQELYEKGYVAEAEVDNARAQAEVNAAQLASAEKNLILVKTRLESDLLSAQEQVKQAAATLATAKASRAQTSIKSELVAQAREAVRQSEAALAYQQARLDNAYIRTPISGTVLKLDQQEGETIVAGLSAANLIIVADLDRLQADAYVDETDIGRVKIGQAAEVTVDAYPDRAFHGKVSKISSKAEVQQNVITYDVTVALDNPEQLLKPDMTATVDIMISKEENVLAVPVDAVKYTVKGKTVTVKSKNERDRPKYDVVEVETGISDGEYVAITKGLQSGQTVVLSGAVPGMSVEEQKPRFFGGGDDEGEEE